MLFALVLSMALVAMDTTIVATAVPQVVGDLHGFDLVAWVFSIYLLTQTVTIPVYGKLADQYGRKPVLVIGILVFLIGSALCAASWNMLALIGFRALQGLGAGSINATVNTVAGDMYTVQERGRIQGYLSSVWGISAVVAPAVGGAFAQYASWRWIFLVNVPIGALALTLIVHGLHEEVARHRHRIDYAGAALLMTATGLLILGLLQGDTWGWGSAPSVATFVGSVIAGVIWVLIERRAAEPVMPIHLWTRRLSGATWAATVTAGMITIGLSVYLPNWAQIVLGLSPVAAGFVLATMSMTWPVTSALSSRLYLRIGFRDTALIGGLFAIGSSLVFVSLGTHSPVILPIVGSMLLGVGMGLFFTPLIVGLQNTVGWSERGVITGGTMFSRYLGQSLGAAVFGAITNSVITSHHLLPQIDRIQASTHAVFVGMLAVAVATAAILILVPRRFPAYIPGPATGDRSPTPGS